MTDSKSKTATENQRDEMKKMVLRVLEEKQDWSKHLHHTCNKCEKCTCGKHLCKYQPVHMDSKVGKSIYHKDYQHKSRIKTETIQAPKTIQNHGQRLVGKSTYGMEYLNKKGDTIEHGSKMKGNLQLGGPLFANTIYQEAFQRKPNQSTQRPMKNLNMLGTTGMKFNTASNYQNTYKWVNPQSNKKATKKTDNLKTQPSAFRSMSSYQHDYIKFNSKNYPAESFKPTSKYEPKNGMEAKSAYRTDYNQKGYVRCPASVYS